MSLPYPDDPLHDEKECQTDAAHYSNNGRNFFMSKKDLTILFLLLLSYCSLCKCVTFGYFITNIVIMVQNFFTITVSVDSRKITLLLLAPSCLEIVRCCLCSGN